MPQQPLTLDTIICRQAGAEACSMNDVTVLLDGKGTLAHGLDPIASRLWDLVDGQRSLRAIAQTVAGEFEAPAPTIEHDVLQFFGDLYRAQLVMMKPVLAVIVMFLSSACLPSTAQLVQGGEGEIIYSDIQITEAESLKAMPEYVPSPVPPALAGSANVTYQQAAEGELRGLTVQVDVIGAHPGELSIEFISPTGAVYERRAVGTTADAFTAQTFAFELPVAGTLIDSSSLWGTWQARALVGDATLCNVAFEVSP